MATVGITRSMGVRGQTITTAEAAGGTADVSDPIDIGNFARGSIQAAGTFGTTTFTVQMSNDGTTWVTAKDTAGADLTFTTAGLKYIQMGPKYLRVQAPSGTGTGLIGVINISY